MVKKINKLLLGAVMLFLLCAVALFPIKAEASMESESQPYTLGNKVQGYNNRYFKWTIKEKSNVYICLKMIKGRDYTRLYDSEGNEVLENGDFVCSYNQVKEEWTFTTTRVLPAGTYYQEINPYYDGSEYTWTYVCTAEPQIKLGRPTITNLNNTGKKQFTVKYGAIKNRTGYQVQYATNSKFSKAKKANTGATTRVVNKLVKGQTYYVRVRAYSLYSSGNAVYSPWSLVQTIKINK